MGMKPRAGIERVDEVVADRLERLIGHERFAVTVGLLHQARHRAGRSAGDVVSGLLHAVNLPNRRDVDRLLVQVGSLERQLREVARRLDEQSRPAD